MRSLFLYIFAAAVVNATSLSSPLSNLSYTINEGVLTWSSTCNSNHGAGLHGCVALYLSSDPTFATKTTLCDASCCNLFKGNRNGSIPKPAGGTYVKIWVGVFKDSTGTFVDVVTDIYQLPIDGQHCTISNPGASVDVGSAFVGRASGSQAGNKYNLAIVAGPGGGTINDITGEYTIFCNDLGTIVWQVWISEGNGYPKSNIVETYSAVVQAPKTKSVTVTIPAGDGLHPTHYDIFQDGKNIGSFDQAGNSSAVIKKIWVDSQGGAVTLVATTSGIVRDGVSVMHNPDGSGNVTTTQNLITNTSTVKNGDTVKASNINSVPIVDTTGKTVEVTNPSNGNPAKNTSGVVWSAGSGQQTDLVTNTVYREGIGKIYQKVEEEFERRKEREKERDKRFDIPDLDLSKYGAEGRETQLSLAVTTAGDKVQQAGDSVQSALESYGPKEIWQQDGANEVALPPVEDVLPQYVVKAGNTEIKADFNPFTNPVLSLGSWSVGLAAVRELILWAMAYAFIRFSCEIVDRKCAELMIVPAFRNSGTADSKVPIYGQGKAFLISLVSTTTVIVFFASIVVFINTNILSIASYSLKSFFGGAGAGAHAVHLVSTAFSAFGANALLAFFLRIFPLDAFLQFTILELLVYMMAVPLFIKFAGIKHSLQS